MRSRMWLTVVAVLAIGSIVLAGCATPTPEVVEKEVEVEVTRVVEQEGETVIEEVIVTATSEPERDPRFGGTFRQATLGLKGFDPVFDATTQPNKEVFSNIYSFLYRMQDYGEPIPDLAASWEWVDDTTLVFNLRQGVMWHDGNEVFAEGESRDVTADDVVYSMERWVNTEGSTIDGTVADAYESIEALDEYTVQLNLKAPTAGLFSQVRGLSNLGIVPQEAVEFYGEDFGANPIGSGPYEFAEFVPDDHVTLTRNEDYWLDCFVDEIEYKIIPDVSVAMIALEAQDVDFVSGVPRADMDRIFNDDNFVTYQRPSKTARMIWFPTGVEDFQEKQFRQAVAYALDQDAIGTNVYGPVSESGTCGTAGRGVPGHVADLCDEYYPYDPEAAKELLAEIGWVDSDGDGIVDRDGEPMEKILINTFNVASMDQVIEIVVTQLREIGLPVETELVEFGTWSENYITCDTPKMDERRWMLWAGCGGPGGLSMCWGEGSPFVPCLGAGYDEKVFELLDEANRAVDPQRHDELQQEATELIFGEYWTVNATPPVGALMASWDYVHDYGSRYQFDNLCTLENNVWLGDEAPGK